MYYVQKDRRDLLAVCGDYLKLISVPETAVFLVPVPSLVIASEECYKIGLYYLLATNLTAQISGELNEELRDDKTTLLQKCVVLDYLLLKEHANNSPASIVLIYLTTLTKLHVTRKFMSYCSIFFIITLDTLVWMHLPIL